MATEPPARVARRVSDSNMSSKYSTIEHVRQWITNSLLLQFLIQRLQIQTTTFGKLLLTDDSALFLILANGNLTSSSAA
jgi:hypothetical protein